MIEHMLINELWNNNLSHIYLLIWIAYNILKKSIRFLNLNVMRKLILINFQHKIVLFEKKRL